MDAFPAITRSIPCKDNQINNHLDNLIELFVIIFLVINSTNEQNSLTGMFEGGGSVFR